MPRFWLSSHRLGIETGRHEKPRVPPELRLCKKMSNTSWGGLLHWSPTVPVSVWLPEPARDRGTKQKTLNDDFYHTTCRSAAIFGYKQSYRILL